MGHYHDVIDELKEPARALRDAVPEAWRGFNQLAAAAMGDGALDRKTKELIALGMSVMSHCDGCIAYHARNCAVYGASEQEVAETLAVAIQMCGGPATTYGPRAFAAYREFAAEHK